MSRFSTDNWEVAQSNYDVCLVLARSSLEVVQSSFDVCLVSAQSSWEEAQSSYDVCLGSAQSSWEVVHSSYDVCHVSAQSSWEVTQSSYDVCLVSAQSSWEVAQSSYDVCFCFSSEYLGSSSEQLWRRMSSYVMSEYCDVLCINALLFVSDARWWKNRKIVLEHRTEHDATTRNLLLFIVFCPVWAS